MPRSISYFASKRVRPEVWDLRMREQAERDLVPVVFASGAR